MMHSVITRTSNMFQDNSGNQYLVITLKGVEFVETWYRAKRVPSTITNLYQLLLRVIWMKGVVSIKLIQRLGYSRAVLEQAASKEYASIVNKPDSLLNEVQQKIKRMIGKPPGEIYA